MLINEVQYKVGLSKKSIRYYESEGLLNIKRNQNNDYREYTEEDIKTLKLIKFLRELNIPIHDIKKLKNKEMSIQECMKERLLKIEEIESDFNRVKNICNELSNSDYEYDNIDITKYFEEMNILNKKGFSVRDMKKNDNKKIWGACLSSLVFSLFYILMEVLFIFVKFSDSSFPMLMFIIFELVFGVPIIGIVINLVKRIAEIKGGEENEASKY